MRGMRALARVVTTMAFVGVYVTLHLGVTAAMNWQERERFRDASNHAVAFAAALERVRPGDTSTHQAILSEARWFTANSSVVGDELSVPGAVSAALAGNLALARAYAGPLGAEVEREQRIHDQGFHEWGRTTAVWALPSASLVALALWLRHLRRRGVADVVEVVRRLVPARPWWQRPVFLLLSGVGFTLLLSGFLAGETAFRGYQLPLKVRLVVGACGVIVAVAGSLILARTRRRSARAAAAALLADGRRPVLYLRSFADDHTSATVDRPPGAWEVTVFNVHSREEQLASALRAFGPVIAVGRPGEPLPYLGAARFYLHDDQWRPEVRRLMELSQLIVLRLGPGEGLWWEVAQARATQPARKLVLLIPGEETDLADRLAEQLPTRSPLTIVHGGDSWTSAVITFDQDWNPHPYPVTPDPRKPLMTPAHTLARTMQTALAAVGVRRRAMAVRVGVRGISAAGRVLLILPVAVLMIRVGLLIFPNT